MENKYSHVIVFTCIYTYLCLYTYILLTPITKGFDYKIICVKWRKIEESVVMDNVYWSSVDSPKIKSSRYLKVSFESSIKEDGKVFRSRNL